MLFILFDVSTLVYVLLGDNLRGECGYGGGGESGAVRRRGGVMAGSVLVT
jgi:hypothetical protein